MRPLYIASTKLAFGLLAAIFTVQVYQVFAQPIRTSEAYLYDRFVRPTTRQVLARELPDHDILYTLLEKRSVGLFHVSPWSVRLPGLLFGVLYLGSVWRMARMLFGAGRMFVATVTVAGLVPLEWNCFARADGVGVALALVALAASLVISRQQIPDQMVSPLYLNLSGACLGLAIAARLEFAVPAAAVGVGALLLRRSWTEWADRILVPALVVALIFLVLPLSHAHAAAENAPELGEDGAERLQSGLAMLRAGAGGHPIRIAAIPAIEPVVNFYRAQHRLTAWERATRNVAAGDADYYLLTSVDAAEQRHLLVILRDADFVLARRRDAPF